MDIEIDIQENKKNFKLEDLISMGKRINNSKRNFLFISKVLGKHLEVKPDKCKDIGKELGSLLFNHEESDGTFKNNEKIAVLGFAETATGLGMAVASFINNSYYLTTTREDIKDIESIIKFEEEHSHATTHKSFPIEPTNLMECKKIILVDDEITTGKSMLNIIKELKRVTNIKDYIILTILDWRSTLHKSDYENFQSKEDINVEVLSLINGHINVNDHTVYYDHSENKLTDKMEVIEIDRLDHITLETKFGQESYIKNSGRFGVVFKDIQGLEMKAESIAGEIQKIVDGSSKVLVLGHGENIYIPCRIASYLSGDIYYKSTTRSPIFAEVNENYPIEERHVFYHKDVKYYFYNKTKIEKEYDKVILITEDNLDIKLCENMIIIKI